LRGKSTHEYNEVGMSPADGPPPPRSGSPFQSLRSKPIHDFFPALCRLRPEIAELRFATYRRRPSLDERLRAQFVPEDGDLVETANRLSQEGVAFWDAVLSVAMERGILKQAFVTAAATHDFNLPERSFRLSREQVLEGSIGEIIPQLAPGEGLLACSRLRVASGESSYLPMLDFACPCSCENSKTIRKLVALGGAPQGVLVRSGRSYHYYGASLLSQEGWLRFVAFSLLFAPVTDSRYMAHRLLDGECRLKIVDSADGFIPLIEEAFGNDAEK